MLDEFIESLRESIWGEIGSKILQKVFGNTFTLVLGWVVSVFLIG